MFGKFDLKAALPYILVGIAIAVFTPVGGLVKKWTGKG